jgi:hypothetical protein
LEENIVRIELGVSGIGGMMHVQKQKPRDDQLNSRNNYQIEENPDRSDKEIADNNC